MPDRRMPDLLALLDLVALATVCDVVPLTGLNRAFVVKGLVAMRGSWRIPGWRRWRASRASASRSTPSISAS